MAEYIAAPPVVQPWIRDVNNAVNKLSGDIGRIESGLKALNGNRPVSFKSGISWISPANTSTIYLTPGADLQVYNATGLLELTVSANMTARYYGIVGVGARFAPAGGDLPAAEITSHFPKYGVVFSSAIASTQDYYFGGSNTTLLPLPLGGYRVSLFYYGSNTQHASARGNILNSTLVVRNI